MSTAWGWIVFPQPPVTIITSRPIRYITNLPGALASNWSSCSIGGVTAVMIVLRGPSASEGRPLQDKTDNYWSCQEIILLVFSCKDCINSFITLIITNYLQGERFVTSRYVICRRKFFLDTSCVDTAGYNRNNATSGVYPVRLCTWDVWSW
jgi:hypothetical protein